MSSDEEYQRRAAECRRIAENVRSPSKRILVEDGKFVAQYAAQANQSESKPQGWPEPNDEDLKTFH